MGTRRSWLGFVLVVLAGCATTPAGPPEEVAPKIVAALDGGEADEAEALFEGSARSDDARERLYPLLYAEARARYERGESAGAARVLRFMVPRYPKARAVREALVYALFLERARAESPSSELVAELGERVTELRGAGGQPPVWVSLVEAQLAIDRGEPEMALEALAVFQGSWDGRPEELGVYVDDLERYLSAHL
jgi:hypothetical protein